MTITAMLTADLHSKGRGTYRRGYEEPPYYHMTPEMYHRDMDRDMGRMYYTETSSSGMRVQERAEVE